MKKIAILSLSFLMVLASCSPSKKSSAVNNPDGSVSITGIDSDKSVSLKTVDGFKNVTAVDCSSAAGLNFAQVSLTQYGGRGITLGVDVDLKLAARNGQNADLGSALEILWKVNDFEAKMPVICQKIVKPGEWTHLSGCVTFNLGQDKSLYINSAGLPKDNLVIYLKDIDIRLEGDGIGVNAAASADWMEGPSLAQAYENEFEHFGIAVGYKGELDRSEIQTGLKRHVNSITMGNELKPDFIFNWQPLSGMTDFTDSEGTTIKVPAGMPNYGNLDKILSITRDMGVGLRGHVLVWHSQTPHWFFTENYSSASNAAYVTPQVMTARQEWYIKSLLEHISDWEKRNNNGSSLIYAWDVVNEAVSDGATARHWLREDSDWFRVYGDETFILNAFKLANKYLPASVELVYNDYNCYSPGKREAICALIDEIRACPGARIDAVGMQSHVKIDYPSLSGSSGSYEEAVKAFIARGVNVQVTELDVANGKLRYSPLQLKSVYKEYFKLFLRNKKTSSQKGIEGVTIWGLTDQGTWLDYLDEYKGYKQYPLLFNGDFSVKSAFYGVLEAVQDKD